MRLIDADELMMHGFQPPEFSVCPVDICHDNVAVDAYKRGWNDAIEAIVQNEPTVEPRTGEWIDGNKGKWNAVYCPKCSVCGTPFYGIETVRYHYCPNCGARMEESDEETNVSD